MYRALSSILQKPGSLCFKLQLKLSDYKKQEKLYLFDNYSDN